MRGGYHLPFTGVGGGGSGVTCPALGPARSRTRTPPGPARRHPDMEPEASPRNRLAPWTEARFSPTPLLQSWTGHVWSACSCSTKEGVESVFQ